MRQSFNYRTIKRTYLTWHIAKCFALRLSCARVAEHYKNEKNLDFVCAMRCWYYLVLLKHLNEQLSCCNWLASRIRCSDVNATTHKSKRKNEKYYLFRIHVGREHCARLMPMRECVMKKRAKRWDRTKSRSEWVKNKEEPKWRLYRCWQMVVSFLLLFFSVLRPKVRVRHISISIFQIPTAL